MAMGNASTSLVATNHNAKSSWAGTVLKLLPMTEGHSYCIYHGKCLLWSLSHFYGGADDEDPLTCFSTLQCM